MKKIFLPVLLFFSLLSASSIAQISGSKDYTRLPYKADFSIAEYIRTSLPENWGFQVPFLKDYNAHLSVGADIEYSFDASDSESLKRPVNFFFALPEKTNPCLELRITGFANEENSHSLKSGFGNWNRVDSIYSEKLETYQHVYNDKIFTFYILTKDEKEKELCRELIRSCKKYYDYEGYQGSEYHHSIEYNAKDSTYYPSLGLGFVIGVDAQADIYAKSFEINETATLLSANLNLDDSDESEKSSFSGSGFEMYYYFSKGSDEMKNSSYTTDEYRSSFDYAVAGIASKVYISGADFAPTIKVEIPVNRYTAYFTFPSIAQENISKVSQFLSQIYLADSIKANLVKAVLPVQSFEELVGIKKLGEKEVTLNKEKERRTKTVNCTFTELGITAEVPFLESHNIGNRKISSDIKSVAIENTNDDGDDGNDNFYITYREDYKTYCHVGILSDNDLQKMISELASAVGNNTMTFLRDGYTVINGHKWISLSLIDHDENNYSIYYTKVNDSKSLIFIAVAPDLKYANNLEAFLPKVSFKK